MKTIIKWWDKQTECFSFPKKNILFKEGELTNFFLVESKRNTAIKEWCELKILSSSIFHKFNNETSND